MKKKCCIIGLGYIGLPTAALLASKGFQVLGVDINFKIISDLKIGLIHIKESGIKDFVLKAVKTNNLFFSTKPLSSDIFIITVPTPFQLTEEAYPKPNLNYIFDAVKTICKVLKKGDLIILESTSPVGTTKEISKLIFELTGFDENQINIAYCPERVIPGNTLRELVDNDRVVGGLTQKSTSMAKNFYSYFCEGNIYPTNAITAELVKLTENSYRDVNIAFANELSLVSDKLGVDVRELIRLSNRHPRVNILQPGCGVGGHCIAVDPWFIVSQNPEITNLIQSARHVNDNKSNWVIGKILSFIEEFKKRNCCSPKVGILGITFKPNIDDLRESPALKITNKLINSGIDILVCEPNIEDHKDFKIYDLNYVLNESNLIFFLVGHKEFKKLSLNNKEYFDFCGIIDG